MDVGDLRENDKKHRERVEGKLNRPLSDVGTDRHLLIRTRRPRQNGFVFFLSLWTRVEKERHPGNLSLVTHSLLFSGQRRKDIFGEVPQEL